MSAAVRAEWTKLRTTPGAAWLLLATLVVTVALGATVCPRRGCGVYLGQTPVAVLAVLTVGGEYSTGLIRTTLAAIPARTVVLAAKALVLAVAVAAVGSLALLMIASAVAYLVLIALLSLGVAAAVRDSAVAIGTVLGLLYLPPILVSAVTDPRLHRLLERIAPMTGGLAVLAAWAAGALLAGTLLFRSRDT